MAAEQAAQERLDTVEAQEQSLREVASARDEALSKGADYADSHPKLKTFQTLHALTTAHIPLYKHYLPSLGKTRDCSLSIPQFGCVHILSSILAPVDGNRGNNK